VFFALAWAAYGILHVLLTSWSLLDPYSNLEWLLKLLAVAAGLFVLGRPSSALRFALFCFLWIGATLSYSPYWPNHLWHTVAINSILLVICLLALLGLGEGATVRERVIAMFAPVGRLSLFVLYFWVVVHKLNYDYLNPEVSCGWALYEQSAQFIKDMTGLSVPVEPWMPYPCLLGALLIEVLIPLFLLFRRTRFAGLVLGGVFHLILSFHQNVFILSFTLMMLAHFVLFTSHDGRAACMRWWQGSWPGKKLSAGRGLRMPLVLSALFLLCVIPVGLANYWHTMPQAALILQLNDEIAWRVSRLVATGYAFFALLLMICFLWRPSSWAHDQLRVASLPKPVVLALFPALLFFNGLSPYIGLKTHHAYAMFSNLRTENQVTNHLFMPVAMRVADYQDDLVFVLESNFDWIPVSEPGVRETRFEIRRRLHYAPNDMRIVYTVNGSEPKVLTYEMISQDPVWSRPTWLIRHALFFKTAMPEDKPCPCRW
jgi:hypothetical protein